MFFVSSINFQNAVECFVVQDNRKENCLCTCNISPNSFSQVCVSQSGSKLMFYMDFKNPFRHFTTGKFFKQSVLGTLF